MVVESAADFALLDYLVVAGATFLASLVSGVGGFGGGFIIAMALTPLVGVKGVIPLISVFAFCSNLARVAAYRKSIDWRRVLLFIFSSTPGVLIGMQFFDWASERLLLVLLGSALIASVPLRRYLKHKGIEPGARSLIAIGLIFGFVSGTAVGSGLFVVASLHGIGLQGPWLLGTDAAIGLINALTRAAGFYSLGLLPPDLILAGVMMGVISFPGTFAARALVQRMGLKRHSAIMEIIICAGGVYFLSRAFL